MSVFTPNTWNMGAVQLVTTTTSQLSTLNSIQAAFTASTYWEQESTGTSSLGYKYIVVRPKAALSSIYRDYRIFICERVNYTTGRIIGDGTAVASRFNTTTAVMCYFCPDGGALTFTAANIESGDIWPGTAYKSGTNTVWHPIVMPSTALWLYEADGVVWMVSRSSATSHTLMALGNVMYIAKDTYIDYNSSSVETGCASFYYASGFTNSTALPGQMFSISVKSNAFWYKPTGVATRTLQAMNGTSIANTGNGVVSSLLATTTYDATATATFTPVLSYGFNNVLAGAVAFRGLYWAGFFKTRTTVQKSGTTIGYTWFPDDTSQTLHGIAFMNS